jgi:hypothetical protein
MEKLHSELGVITDLSTLEMRASATAKVAAKAIKHIEIDVLHSAASPLDEAAEVGGGSNVPNGAGWRISVAFEVICKRINVWSADPAAQAPQRFGSGEKRL